MDMDNQVPAWDYNQHIDEVAKIKKSVMVCVSVSEERVGCPGGHPQAGPSPSHLHPTPGNYQEDYLTLHRRLLHASPLVTPQW